jgi:hypothetical protein
MYGLMVKPSLAIHYKMSRNVYGIDFSTLIDTFLYNNNKMHNIAIFNFYH